MTLCKDVNANTCQGACCYFPDKPLTGLEVSSLSSDEYLKLEGEYRLRNDHLTCGSIW